MDDIEYRPFDNPRDIAPSYDRIDARLSWLSPEGTFEVTAWGKNLNEGVGNEIIDTFGAAYGWWRGGIPKDPRTLGVTLRYMF